jgi:hypothetical protein
LEVTVLPSLPVGAWAAQRLVASQVAVPLL